MTSIPREGDGLNSPTGLFHLWLIHLHAQSASGLSAETANKSVRFDDDFSHMDNCLIRTFCVLSHQAMGRGIWVPMSPGWIWTDVKRGERHHVLLPVPWVISSFIVNVSEHPNLILSIFETICIFMLLICFRWSVWRFWNNLFLIPGLDLYFSVVLKYEK